MSLNPSKAFGSNSNPNNILELSITEVSYKLTELLNFFSLLILKTNIVKPIY